MDEEININLRPYIETLIRRWRWVVGVPIIAMIIALGASLLLQPVYEARVFVAVAKQKVDVQFGTQIQTLTDQQLGLTGAQAQVNRDARLATFRVLVTNPAIAQEVLPQFADRLRTLNNEKLLDTSRFLEDHVSVDQDAKSDLIGIVISLPDPTLAAEIADAWAQAYEQHINSLYTTTQPADVQAVGAQAEESKQTYQTAQKELETYLSNNPTPRLVKQIEVLQAQIDSYQTALVDTETLVNSRELATRRQLLSGYYTDLVTLEKLLNDARALKLQVLDGEASPAAAFGDALAMIFIRSYTFAGTRSTSQSSQSSTDSGTQSSSQSSAPFSLQLQTPMSSQPVTSSDVEGLIGALEQRKKETEATISTLTATLLAPPQYTPPTGAGEQIKTQVEKWTVQIQSLQAKLEAEAAHRKDLERERDLAWGTYSQLAKKTAEVQVAVESGGTEVRVASKALPPTEPAKSGKLLIVALAGLGAFLVIAFAVLVIEWWQKNTKRQILNLSK